MLTAVLAVLLAVTPSPDPTASLDQFAGRWELKGQSITTKGTTSYLMSEDCEWSSRHAFMICEDNVHGSKVTDVTLMWWNPADKLIHFTGLDLSAASYKGTIDIAGDTWTWGSGPGKRQFRTLNHWTSPDRIEYTSQNSIDGGATWTTDGKGTETRVTSP
jgi:hypothetical protein